MKKKSSLFITKVLELTIGSYITRDEKLELLKCLLENDCLEISVDLAGEKEISIQKTNAVSKKKSKQGLLKKALSLEKTRVRNQVLRRLPQEDQED